MDVRVDDETRGRVPTAAGVPHGARRTRTGDRRPEPVEIENPLGDFSEQTGAWF